MEKKSEKKSKKEIISGVSINNVNATDCVFKRIPVEIKDIIGDKVIENIYYRYRWNVAKNVSELIPDNTKKTLTISNCHKPEFVSMIEDIATNKPNSYILCTNYSFNYKNKSKLYSDTQIGITGAGNSVGDIVREFEEEVGITTTASSVKKIKYNKWNYYIYEAKDMVLAKTFAHKSYGYRDIINKRLKNKVIGFVIGTFDEIINIFDGQKIISRRDASDIKDIYGFDLLKVEFILEYLKWYYSKEPIHGRSIISFR